MNDANTIGHKNARPSLGRGEPLGDNEPRILSDLFRNAAVKYPDVNFLNFKSGGRWRPIGASEMIDRVEACARGLHSLGIRKGERVAILAPNSSEWTITDAACQFIGVVDVPIYTTSSLSSVEFILRDSGSRVLFLQDSSSFAALSDAISKVDSLEKIILFNGEPSDGKLLAFSQLLKNGRESQSIPNSESELPTSVSPDDVATLIYTSGTTGEPKGVMLTHNNIISNVIDCSENYDFGPHDIPLSVLPLSHIFERSAMYLYIYHGMSVHFAESVEKVADNLADVRPTILIGVPRIFEKVYEKAKLRSAQAGGMTEKIFEWGINVAKQYALFDETQKPSSLRLRFEHKLADILVFSKLRRFFGGRLRYCLTGGAALSDDIFLTFHGAGIAIMQGYGLTETSPVVSSNNPFENRLGSVGKPIRNMRVRIADDGEIEVSGPGVTIGYYNKPDATREAFTDDGWFRTGDIGRIDEDGFLFVTDRKKELFKTSGGKYIAPTPIEQMIRSSRFVNQVVLVGNERKFAAALIVPDFEMLDSYVKHKGMTAMNKAELCRDKRVIDLIERQVAQKTEGLARFEAVKKIALLENEFSIEGGELTPTMKIKRRVIDQKYRDVIDSLYSEENDGLEDRRNR